MNVQSIAAPGRSAVLRNTTHLTHERLDAAIMAAKPFDNLANYRRFLLVQHAFHRDVAPLYLRAELQALIPDLDRRSRLAQLAQDAADIWGRLSCSRRR
jgi:heme oxygenase